MEQRCLPSIHSYTKREFGRNVSGTGRGYVIIIVGMYIGCLFIQGEGGFWGEEEQVLPLGQVEGPQKVPQHHSPQNNGGKY